MRSTTKTAVYNLALIAVFTAVVCICSQLTIPLPLMPITLQTFGICLCGFVLKAKSGVISVLVYLLLGTVGVPVFSAFRAGPSMLFGPTGGFLWGFLLLALAAGLGAQVKSRIAGLGLAVLGLLVCFSLGAAQYRLVTGVSGAGALVVLFLPLLLKDTVLLFLAYPLAFAIQKRLPKQGKEQ